MLYPFPAISHISDVLPCIENRSEFIVAEKDGYTVINYMVANQDTFGHFDRGHLPYMDAVRRECRGIVFDEKGEILSRRFHKFFNVNERPETQTENLKLGLWQHRIVHKLDGSMITPLVIRGNVRWGTKMGITDTAMEAERFVSTRENYVDFAKDCHEAKITPIFEWCSRKNRIVIDYAEENLTLLAMRMNVTGEYLNRYALAEFAGKYNLPLVGQIAPFPDANQFLDWVRGRENEEGFIIQFLTGHMLKVKTDWYVRIHKAKEKILQEKNVIELLLNNGADDIKPFLTDLDRKRLNRFETDFWIGIRNTELHLQRDLEYVEFHNFSRKYVAQCKDFRPEEKSMIFKCLDGHRPYDVVLNVIKKNLSTQTKVDSIRHLFGSANWNDTLRTNENELD